MEQFLLDITVPSMWRDTLSSALPVKVTNLNTNERIVELVEVGGFGKASAIVAMAASIVDPGEFINRTQVLYGYQHKHISLKLEIEYILKYVTEFCEKLRRSISHGEQLLPVSQYGESVKFDLFMYI